MELNSISLVGVLFVTNWGMFNFLLRKKVQDFQGRIVSVVMPQDKLMEKYGHLKKYKVEDFFKSREVEGVFEG